MLIQFPEAYTWEASSWADFARMWVTDCTEYHHHPASEPPTRSRLFTSPTSTAPSTPSSLTLSPPLSPAQLPLPSPTKRERQSQRNAAEYNRLVAEEARLVAEEAQAAADAKRKEEMAFLAAFRPPPGPISPQRLQQQFTRVLGPAAALQRLPEKISRILPAHPPADSSSDLPPLEDHDDARPSSHHFYNDGPPPQMNEVSRAWARAAQGPEGEESWGEFFKARAEIRAEDITKRDAASHRQSETSRSEKSRELLAAVAADLALHGGPSDQDAPVIYGVSGHNRLFKSSCIFFLYLLPILLIV
jgi:hypothetical protein